MTENSPNERIKGFIKWFSHEKCYGFIRRDDGLADVFVHMNSFRNTMDAYWLTQGDPVEFSVENTSQGPHAVDVVVRETAVEGERLTGRIKWFSREKGYGFIRRGDGKPDLFAHTNDFRDATDVYWLKRGDAVEFVVKEAEKGPKAVDIVLTEKL